jgi:hypothetical protein
VISYRELLGFPPFQALFEDSAVVNHVRDLERRIFDPSTPITEVERLRCERKGVLKVLDIVQALAQREEDQEASEAHPGQPRQRLADTFLPRRL